MTTVLVVVLVMLWGALILSWFVRSRSAGSFTDSVGTFRRHLSVLERATPQSVRPANRLREAGPLQRSPFHPGLGSLPRSVALSGPGGTRRPAPPQIASAVPARSTMSSGARRRHAQKRRRDIFFALLAGVIGSFLLALITGLSLMWAVQVMFDVVLAAYVALLVRIRNLTAEREMKLRYMPSPGRARRVRPSYDFGAGYGELELRRIAN